LGKLKSGAVQAPGSLYVIAAPSGAGKTSLVKRLLETTSDIVVSVSHTTRPPRYGEREGVDYHFVDLDTFQALVQEGVFLEYAQVFDHWYGTSGHALRERLRTGVDVILEIDWQGSRQVCVRMPETRTIFILPPSLEALRQRLTNRGQDSEAVIERRMADAISQMSHYREFAYIVINEDFNEALEALRAIFIGNRQLREVQVLRRSELLSALLS
jgi:guanylate kinase